MTVFQRVGACSQHFPRRGDAPPLDFPRGFVPPGPPRLSRLMTGSFARYKNIVLKVLSND